MSRVGKVVPPNRTILKDISLSFFPGAKIGVLGLNGAVVAEGLSFSESLGFAPAVVLEILKETPAASMVMESKGKKTID